MTYRIEQILLRPAVWIVTGNTRLGAWFDPVMGVIEITTGLIVTLGTQFTTCRSGQGVIIAAVRIMAGRTILCRRLMQGAISPVPGHLAVTFEAKSRLGPSLKAGIRRAMATVAGHALHLRHRLMRIAIAFDLVLNIGVTVETDLARFCLDQIGLAGSMSSMAGKTVLLAKGIMG